MKIVIEGTEKEIADLVTAMQDRRKFTPDHKKVSLEKKEFMNLMKKHSKSRSRLKF